VNEASTNMDAKHSILQLHPQVCFADVRVTDELEVKIVRTSASRVNEPGCRGARECSASVSARAAPRGAKSITTAVA
jgi:hypothetical protein